MYNILLKIWNNIPSFIQSFIQNFVKYVLIKAKILFDRNLYIKTTKYSVIKNFAISELLNWGINLWKKIRIWWKNSLLWKIKIWDYSYIAWDCLILWSHKYWIEIWKFCSIASWVSFLIYNDHNPSKLTTYPPISWTVRLNKKDKEIWESVIVWNDVWIWKNAIILKWVNLWTWCIVWAWSVVTKNVPPYAIVWWNPAKVIKYRFEDKMIKKLLESERRNREIEKIYNNYNLENF